MYMYIYKYIYIYIYIHIYICMYVYIYINRKHPHRGGVRAAGVRQTRAHHVLNTTPQSQNPEPQTRQLGLRCKLEEKRFIWSSYTIIWSSHTKVYTVISHIYVVISHKDDKKWNSGAACWQLGCGGREPTMLYSGSFEFSFPRVVHNPWCRFSSLNPKPQTL